MNDLSSQSCEACQIDAPKVPQDQIQILLSEISGWVLIDKPINKLQKVFSFQSYKESVDFTNKVASLAEDVNHHPQILLEWGKVTVIWWSHKIEGLHKNDFICAAKTDKLL